jgi:hypothetical protein
MAEREGFEPIGYKEVVPRISENAPKSTSKPDSCLARIGKPSVIDFDASFTPFEMCNRVAHRRVLRGFPESGALRLRAHFDLKS